jgi:hypothetical protein
MAAYGTNWSTRALTNAAKIAGWINAATSALVAISRRWPMPPNSPQLAKQLKTRKDSNGRMKTQREVKSHNQIQ